MMSSPAVKQENENSVSAVSNDELIVRLAEDSARQTAALEKQLLWTRVQTWVIGGALILLLIIVLSFMGRINSAIDELDKVLSDVQSVTASLKATMDEADIDGLLRNADSLITQSKQSLTEALNQVADAVAQLKKIDFDGLNSAITDLQAIVDPFARLFGK